MDVACDPCKLPITFSPSLSQVQQRHCSLWNGNAVARRGGTLYSWPARGRSSEAVWNSASFQ